MIYRRLISELEQGEILVRVDEGYNRAVLIGIYLCRADFLDGIVVFNPVINKEEVVYGFIDDVTCLDTKVRQPTD